MKLIILVDKDAPIPTEVVDKIGKDKLWFTNTTVVRPEDEYDFLNNTIGGFIKTDKKILIAKFSGREEIATRLGDECSEMLVYLTNNQNNKYYIEEYLNTFINFIDIFYKETSKC